MAFYDRLFFLLWAVVTIWLLAAGLTNQGETGDGYQSVVNTRFLLGDATFWYVQRGPLNTFLLLPAEIARQVFDLHPMDVRPYHMMTTLIHSGFLLGVWFLLRQQYPAHGQARLLVFVSTILSLMFYAWSVQISPDILPGLMFLSMILLTQRWFEQRMAGQSGNKVLFGIIALGVAGPLIKPTYVIFWITVWVYAAIAFLRTYWAQARQASHHSDHLPRVTFNDLWRFSTAGGASALAVWFAYAAHASYLNPDPFLIRPISFAREIYGQIEADKLPIYFPWYIYLINLHNFGLATLALVTGLLATKIPYCRKRLKQLTSTETTTTNDDSPPRTHEPGTPETGAVAAQRVCNQNDRRQRYRHSFQLFCLVFCLVFMHVTSYREVRYLMYLMPLLALILTPVLYTLLSWKKELRALILVLLLVDYVRIIPFALAQVTLGSHLNIQKLFDVANSITDRDKNKVLVSPVISFALFPDSPIIGDRYHGYYHLTGLLFFNLFESKYIVKSLPYNFGFRYDDLTPGDAIVYANHQLVRTPARAAEDNAYFENFFQASGIVKTIDLKREGDQFYPQNTTKPLLIAPPGDAYQPLAFYPTSMAAKDLVSWNWAKPEDDTARIVAVEVDVICKRGWCYPVEEAFAQRAVR